MHQLTIAGKAYRSRLLVGTGKYKDFAETRAAIDASGAEIVTVAIRRTNIGQDASQPNLLDALPPSQFTILPNTAGCYTADDAVRTLRLARELLDGHPLCKLEVLGDPTSLFPNMPETLKAAETLVKDGFHVMVYCSDDPIQAKMLEEIGCVAVMPLASLIGSGMGILNPWNLRLIIDNAKVPVIVDAGVGTASDATIAMELGCDGVLMNTAIAHAKNPILMASAMQKGVEAGREAFLAGRMPRKLYLGRPIVADFRIDWLMSEGIYTEGRAGDEPEKNHGHIKSFVRRAGRMSEAQERFYSEMMPKIGVVYQNGPIDLAAVYGRDNPKILEIGTGMGETTAKIADANRDNDYLGVEVHVPGVGALCKQIAERELGNLRICQHDAVEVVRDMLPEGSLSGIHVFFPDPWHKARHNKRRLIQSPFVALLASRLKPGGYFHCATDWEEYAHQMLEVLSAEPTLVNGSDGFAPRPDYRPLTKFENRGLRLGHGVWDVIFRKR